MIVRKANDVNWNAIETKSHSEYKDVLLNKKSFSHSINRVQSKDHRIGNCEVNKSYLSCFDDKIFLLNNGIWWITSCLLELITRKQLSW